MIDAYRATNELLNILKKKGYEVKSIRDDIFEAFKELSPVGIKKRVIHFFIAYTRDMISKDYVKKLNKLWNKVRPIKLRTFYFYNIVLITESGADDEALEFIRTKMYESWNVRPMFIWDIFNTSYTKITHIVDLNKKVVAYLYDLEDLRYFIHREVTEIMHEFTNNVLVSTRAW